MHARIFSNGVEVSVKSFVERFVGAVSLAVVSSLKAPSPEKCIDLELDTDRIALKIDSKLVALDRNQGFAGTLVRDTIQGMIHNLKGIDARTPVRIVVEIEEQPWPDKRPVEQL